VHAVLTAWPGWRCGGPERWLPAVLLLLAGATACHTTSPKAPQATLLASVAPLGADPDVPIVGLEVVPPAIFVDATQAATLDLVARIWTGSEFTRRSLPASSIPPLVWTVSPAQTWLTLQSQNENRVTLQITPGGGVPVEAVVTVTAGGWSARSRIIPVTASDQDLLEAAHSDGSPPVFVTRGIPDAPGAVCSTNWSAFLGTAPIGHLVEECNDVGAIWGAAILDATHAMMMLPVQWTPAPDRVQGTSSQLPLRTLPVSLWIVVGHATNPDSLRDLVRRSALAVIPAVNATLAENRVGVELDVVNTVIVPTSDESTIVSDCVTGDDLVSDGDRPGTLRVYYVNTMGNARGFTCAGTDDRPQSAIYISWQDETPTTLVHEVGHVLGLTLPAEGHVDHPAGTGSVFLDGFDATNVMTSGISDLDPVGRHRLSVGQVFRMNADSGSWLNAATEADGLRVREAMAPRLACQCGAADPTGYCPRLRDDVAQPGGGAGTSNSWDCYDLLRVPDPGPEDEPVGILFGRMWRAPIQHCGSEVSNYRPDHWSASYLGFQNFTRPGKCPSWAAVLFRKHGLLYRRLTEEHDLWWSDAADVWRIDDGIPPLDADGLPLLSVPVQLYYPSAQEAHAKEDIVEAQRVFGEANRSGIHLEFEMHPSSTLPLPCPASTSKGLNICYSASGVAKGSLSHLVGRAFELPALTASAFGAAFKGNVMQSAPDARSERLTLGQVFRINAFLRPDELPNCKATPDPCPPLATEFP